MTPLPRPALIATVHLPALPGSPQSQFGIEAITQRAVDEARLLAEHRFDGIIVENFGDVPFFAGRVGPHTVAAMALILSEVRSATQTLHGINVLRNDAQTAIAVAAMTGADFVRVNVHTGAYATDQGLIEGQAAQTLRYRRALGADVAIFADVHVKHASPLTQQDLAAAAEETAYRGLADVLIVTGPTTGRPPDLDDVMTVRRAVTDRPILVGSGVGPENVGEILSIADGIIVGTCLKQEARTENPLDPTRVRSFVRAAGR